MIKSPKIPCEECITWCMCMSKFKSNINELIEAFGREALTIDDIEHFAVIQVPICKILFHHLATEGRNLDSIQSSVQFPRYMSFLHKHGVWRL